VLALVVGLPLSDAFQHGVDIAGVSQWLLATGDWADAGVWVDTATWSD